MSEENLQKTVLLSERDIVTKTRRLAFEILENHPETELVFVGVMKRGVTLARRVAELISAEKPDIPIGSIDIGLYRDDLDNLGTVPSIRSSEIPFEIEGANVILFDDVLFTGRTTRAAIGNLMDFGRAARIELAVLIDRGNRELPIAADYTGHVEKTTRDDYIRVRLKPDDDEEAIYLMRKTEEDAP